MPYVGLYALNCRVGSVFVAVFVCKTFCTLASVIYNSVQNLFSSSLLSTNLKFKIYRTIILPVVLYGCETWSLIEGGTYAEDV